MLTIFGGLLMPFAHLKTGRFHYEVFGDKQLPAVLLIMGLGMPAAGWPRSFISMLLEKSLRVITVDNRDAGLSEHFSHLKTSMSVPAAAPSPARPGALPPRRYGPRLSAAAG